MLRPRGGGESPWGLSAPAKGGRREPLGTECSGQGGGESLSLMYEMCDNENTNLLMTRLGTRDGPLDSTVSKQ